MQSEYRLKDDQADHELLHRDLQLDHGIVLGIDVADLQKHRDPLTPFEVTEIVRIKRSCELPQFLDIENLEIIAVNTLVGE